MTDSFRCSKRLSNVLTAVLLAAFPLQAMAQRTVWELPQYMETVRVGSFAVGSTKARDTYLSESTYSGFAIGFESDSWRGYESYRLFRFGRTHSNLSFGLMENPVGGGNTMVFSGHDYAGFMWPAVMCNQCDLLIGPAVMCELGVLYNQQNSNNPVNIEGYVGAGVCVDNTFRFRLFRYDMALQASFYAPLAGMGFAPDYDQSYYYMLRYSEFDKALHFIYPVNNPAFTQQVALVLPIKGNRIRVGMTLDGMKNRLGGHSRFMYNSMFTIGCAMRYQTKLWSR